jgi:RNA polymerase sigma factor (TIGR02999 family)
MEGGCGTGRSAGELTRLLQAWSSGDDAARDAVVPLLYSELRRRAAALLRHEGRFHTFSPTDLANEAYLRIARQASGWRNREQFFAIAARLMRRILVDHARARKAAKRGRALRVTLVEGMVAAPPPEVDLIELDDALAELAARDERQAQLVELRFFGGLSHDESASAMGMSTSTAKREWAMAKAWLYRRMSESMREPSRRSGRHGR